MKEKLEKSGFTFGNIISLIGLAAGILAVWVRLEVAIATLNVRMNTNEVRIEQLLLDNKAEHKEIINELKKITSKDEYK